MKAKSENFEFVEISRTVRGPHTRKQSVGEFEGFSDYVSKKSTPEGGRHTKKANHPISSENPLMYPLKQSEHKIHASLFTF